MFISYHTRFIYFCHSEKFRGFFNFFYYWKLSPNGGPLSLLPCKLQKKKKKTWKVGLLKKEGKEEHQNNSHACVQKDKKKNKKARKLRQNIDLPVKKMWNIVFLSVDFFCHCQNPKPFGWFLGTSRCPSFAFISISTIQHLCIIIYMILFHVLLLPHHLIYLLFTLCLGMSNYRAQPID